MYEMPLHIGDEQQSEAVMRREEREWQAAESEAENICKKNRQQEKIANQERGAVREGKQTSSFDYLRGSETAAAQ